MRRCLFLGGSSGLARTLFEESPALLDAISGLSASSQSEAVEVTDVDIVLTGAEPRAPAWLEGASGGLADRRITLSYERLDLCSADEARKLGRVLRGDGGVDTLVVAVRRSLVFGDGSAHTDLLVGLAALLEELVDPREGNSALRSILHVSSVAAADHLAPQKNWSEADDEAVVATVVRAPYDTFKLQTEALIDRFVAQANASRKGACALRSVHLRVSALFSNNHRECIQVSALAMQARIAPRTTVSIDCNSSRNTAAALWLVLRRLWLLAEPALCARPLPPLASAYYYTRGTTSEVPYHAFVSAYREARGITLCVFLPAFVATLMLWLVRVLAVLTGGRLGVVQNLLYLMRVASHDHTFDNTRFREHFPIGALEEDSVTAFTRIYRTHSKSKKR
jgi:hypothetical protein